MIYLVTGYPRSGTSMLCQALEAGGMSVVKSAERDGFNRMHSDEHYQPNPGSLYEAPFPEMREPGWPRQHDGKVVKVVAPFLHLLTVHDYRVVFMRRDPEEIRQSYEAAFGQRLQLKKIEEGVERAEEMLRNRKDVGDLTVLWYRDVIVNPLVALAPIRWPFDFVAAASVVRPEMCRFRHELLTVGA